MNKKGFTLVEIVAVICVLALIMIVVVPAVQKSLTNAKTGISNINKKNIEEAAKTLGTEILFCDDESDTELKTNLGVTSCAEAKTDLEATLKFSLGDLEAWGYFSDDSGNCKNDLDKNITILSDENDKITVSLDKDITCKK